MPAFLTVDRSSSLASSISPRISVDRCVDASETSLPMLGSAACLPLLLAAGEVPSGRGAAVGCAVLPLAGGEARRGSASEPGSS